MIEEDRSQTGKPKELVVEVSLLFTLVQYREVGCSLYREG